jgi:apolipoprotein N-acyltransferase
MSKLESNSKIEFNKISFLYLGIGAILSLFYNGKWILPIATWLAPVFLMRFSRTHKPVIGFLMITVICSVTSIITWQGLIPLRGVPYYLMMIIGSLFGALLYLIDRLIATRFNNFLSTLVFPLTSVALEYLRVSTSLYGANGSIALTQNNLPLLQIISITGIWGIVFLITWFAPFINWIWERQRECSQIRTGTFIFVVTILAVFLYGNIHLTFFPPDSETIRISSITSKLSNPDIPSDTEDWESFRKISADKQENILNLSLEAARIGANIIIWHEGEIFILKEDEPEFVNKGRELAKKENVFLGMAIATFTRKFPEEYAENKIVWLDTTGNVLFEYLKAIPTPTEKCIAGDGKVKFLNYPDSKIASTICFDLDFPSFIRKFGEAGTDIMISPANDWGAIAKTHPQQVSLRAIEQGFSLVRPNSKSGISIAYDYQGKIISSLDNSRTDQPILISDAPKKGATTIYSQIGDLFAWLCSFGFIIIVVKGIYERRKVHRAG